MLRKIIYVPRSIKKTCQLTGECDSENKHKRTLSLMASIALEPETQTLITILQQNNKKCNH